MGKPVFDLATLQTLISSGSYGGKGYIMPSTAVVGLSAAFHAYDLDLWQGAGDELTTDEIDDIDEILSQLEYDLMMTGDLYLMDRVKVTNSASVSLPASTPVEIPFNTEIYDTNEMHDNALNNNRLYCVEEGMHLINCATSTLGMANGSYYLKLFWYDSTIPGFITPFIDGKDNTTAPNLVALSVSCQLYLHVGDYVQTQMFQTSIATATLWKAGNSPIFSMVRM